MAVAVCKTCGERAGYKANHPTSFRQLRCLVCVGVAFRKAVFATAGRVWCESCGEQLDHIEVNRVVGRALCGPCQFRLQGSK